MIKICEAAMVKRDAFYAFFLTAADCFFEKQYVWNSFSFLKYAPVYSGRLLFSNNKCFKKGIVRKLRKFKNWEIFPGIFPKFPGIFRELWELSYIGLFK